MFYFKLFNTYGIAKSFVAVFVNDYEATSLGDGFFSILPHIHGTVYGNEALP